MDELTKISEAATPASAGKSNAAAPTSMKTGMGSNSMVSTSTKVGLGGGNTPSSNPIKANASAKPTNYSIVNSTSPSAAFGSAAATSKSVPPPPVRT